MGTPIYSGRDFTWRDPPTSANVAIINRAMARQYFGTETPLGARIESHDETFEIVAVVGNAKYLDVREAIQPTVYSVARRTNEIGIRMALGAQAVQIAGMVVREALLLTTSGIVAGIAAALLLSGTLRALLYGLTPTDRPTALTVAALMLVTGLLATYLPSRRATHIDPTVALRAE
jgi:hypothetical protein